MRMLCHYFSVFGEFHGLEYELLHVDWFTMDANGGKKRLFWYVWTWPLVSYVGKQTEVLSDTFQVVFV